MLRDMAAPWNVQTQGSLAHVGPLQRPPVLTGFLYACGLSGHATVASLRAAGGFVPLKVPHVAYADRKFDSPSGKIEFYSSQAGKLGLPPLPMHKVDRFAWRIASNAG